MTAVSEGVHSSSEVQFLQICDNIRSVPLKIFFCITPFWIENGDTRENVFPESQTQSAEDLENGRTEYGVSLGHSVIPLTVPSLQKIAPAHGRQKKLYFWSAL